ncbi:MAG: hypothetical protein Fur0046_21350 [Cyanobacteria bacterium J069]|nr:MAG: hypothetical protein D6742_09045 [Cyanobacteria bacterium J069]
MKKSIYSLTMLAPALAVGALGEAAEAAQSPVNLRAEELYSSLQLSVCSNDWNGALRAIAPLIASAGIAPESRQQLVEFRHQLEDLRAVRAVYANLPNCQNSPQPLWSDQAAERTIVFAPEAQDISFEQLYAAFQGSVCSSDWNEALRVIGPMIGSPGISPEYRAQLVQYRRQLETWRASQAAFSQMEGCSGGGVVWS